MRVTASNDPTPPPQPEDLSASLLRRVHAGYKPLELKGALTEAFARYRAIVGPTKLDNAAAETALRELLRGGTPDPTQLVVLGLALRALRPGLCVVHDTVEPLPPHCAPSFPGWDDFTDRLRPHLRAVGRIDGPGRTGAMVAFGTGFLVTPDLLLTNRHVVRELSFGTGVLPPGRATVNFTFEHGLPIAPPIAIHACVRLDADGLLDLALLRLAAPACRPEACFRFSERLAASDDPVAAFGFPAESSERNPAFVEQVFVHKLGLKRLSPGQVSLRMLGRPVFCHDASTLGGSSGSPVLRQSDAAVLGVHCGGNFLDANEAIDGPIAAQWLRDAPA